MMMKMFLTAQFKLEAGVTTIAYGAAALSLLFDVAGRELLGTGIWGAPRFAVYAAIVAGFLGLSLAAADNSHIRPRMLDFVIPARFDARINQIADLLSALLFVGFGYLAVNYVWVTYQNGDIAPVLDWPIWPIQCIMPYTFFSVALRYFLQAMNPLLKPDSIGAGDGI